MPCQATVMSRTRRVPDTASRRPVLTHRAAGFMRQRWRAYWDWRARKATIVLLRSLDRRTLADIGIAPSEIESIVSGDCDRCRRYDAAWWRR
jgi:uncharacterized protein YjiS (DUF1127 family)